MLPDVKKFDPSKEYYFNEGCYITEIINSKDDPDLSIARARVEPGVTTKLHKLINTIERYVIVEGEGLVEVGDMTPCEVGVGDTVIIPAECPQKITNVGARDLIFLAICSPRFKINHYIEI